MATKFRDWTSPEYVHASVKPRIRVEQKIARYCVRQLLAAGYSLSVFDGEEVTIERSKDAATVVNAMNTTDDDYLFVYEDGEKDRKGWVRFVYGNDGGDVICDYTTNLDATLDKVMKYAEAFG